MTPVKSLKVGPNDGRKVRRSRLLQKWKAEIESESVGSRDYRKMRLARSLHRTQSFCNSRARWRTGSSLILETRLFIEGGPKWRLFWNWEPNLSSREGCNQNRAKNGSVPNSGIKIIYQWEFKNYVRDNTRVKRSYWRITKMKITLELVTKPFIWRQIRSKFVGSSTCTSDMPHQRACLPD